MRGGAGGVSLGLLLALAGCDPRVELDFFPAEGPAGAAGAAGASGAPNTPEEPSLVVTGTMNLSRDNAPGRSCADGGEAVSYSVVALSAQSATLAKAPASGCLQAGDEVLLANMQGTRDATSQVGRYELLRIRDVKDAVLTFQQAKTASYGATEGRDDAIGTAEGEQRVVLQRVPSFERIEVRHSATLTADAWNGATGGVLALRARRSSVIDGRLHMDGRGFRGGVATEPAEAPGQQGESVTGLGGFAFETNLGGGGGGIADQTTSGCQQDGYPGGGGGHVTAGSAATVMDLCQAIGAGLGGQVYALSGRLFLGSGGGSAGTDNVRVDNPPGGAGGAGGGIVWLISESITGAGSITARGAVGVGDPLGVECLGGSVVDCYDHSGPGGGGAGGSVRLSANRIDVLTTLSSGGRGGNGNDAVAGNGGDGGDGLVLIE